MDENKFLSEVKSRLGITGDFQNETLLGYISDTIEFLVDAGVKETNITVGIVARGVSDLWNYGSGNASFSSYFMQRAIQLAYKGEAS